jgi:hypothetical protein
LADADAIAAISTSTLTETARYSVGVPPKDVAVAGGKIWFGYQGAYAGTGGIGSLDPGTSPATVSLKTIPTQWYGSPGLGSAPGRLGLLVAADLKLSPPAAVVYDVSTTPVTTVASRNLGTWGSGVRVASDGSQVVVGDGLYSTADLSAVPGYPIQPPASYVSGHVLAFAPGGAAAVGLEDDTYRSSSVEILAPGGTIPLNSYAMTGGYLQDLAWGPDDTRLFAVTEYGGSPTLTVLLNPTSPAATYLTAAAAASSVVPGQAAQVSGRLTSGITLPAGIALHVTRVGVRTGSVALPDVPTAGDGSFTLQDAPAAEDTYTYTVSYGGDAAHKASSATAQVQVAKLQPSLWVTAPATTPRGQQFTITGQLSYAPYSPGETVHVTHEDPSGATAAVDVPVGTDGTFSFQDTPQIGGGNTYDFSYAGDATHTSAETFRTVDVAREATSLTLSTNAGVYAYGAWAKVIVHLGPTVNSRALQVVAAASDGTAAYRTGNADAHGNFVEWFRMTTGTTFTAYFAGDYRYQDAQAAGSVAVHVGLAESLRGYSSSTHLGRTLYRVYRGWANPEFNVTVAPAKGGCVTIRMQAYVVRGWRDFARPTCVYLFGSRAGLGWLFDNREIGHQFRVQASMGGDQLNLAATGDWLYFLVRR